MKTKAIKEQRCLRKNLETAIFCYGDFLSQSWTNDLSRFYKFLLQEMV